MTPDEAVKLIAAGNTTNTNLLFLMVILTFILVVVVLFNAVRVNSVLTNFIMNMGGRSTAANELSGKVGQANTDALSRQSKTVADIVTGQEEIGGDVRLILTLSRSAGDKIITLAKYAIAPTVQGKIDVKEIAEEKTAEDEKPAGNAALPPNTVEVTLPVKLIEKDKPE